MVEQRAAHAIGTGGRAARSRLGSTTKTRSVETTTNAVDHLTRVSRQDFVLPQPAVGTSGRAARSRNGVEQRGLEPVVEQRAKRAISRDHHHTRSIASPGFLDRTSSFLNQRWVPVVEQRGLEPVASKTSDQSRPPPRGRSPHRVSRQDFVLPQPAVGTGGRAARSRLGSSRPRRDQSRPPPRGRSPHRVSRQDFVLPQPAVGTSGRAARSRTGGRAARSRPARPPRRDQSRPPPTRSIASPGFETGLRPSSTSGGYRWSSSEVSTWLATRLCSCLARPRPSHARSRPGAGRCRPRPGRGHAGPR